MPTAQDPQAPIADAVRDQAIDWFTQAQSGDMSAAQAENLQRWRQADPEHERAWQRLAGISRQLQQRSTVLSNPLARNTLSKTRLVEADRRQLLKLLFGAGLLGGAAWQVSDSFWLQSTLADYHTGIGERRHHTLADGTKVWLNTRTLLDVRFSAQERQLILRQGEVDLLTGSDPAGRPLLVYTGEARLQPLGTRFTVRRDNDTQGTLLAVSNGRVAAQLASGGDTQVVPAGFQTRIDHARIQPLQPASQAENAWVDGFIVAERMRLGDFVEELARYRLGVLRCDPAVADLRLTGSYPLADPARILSMLEQSLPVRVEQRTPWWVTITAR